MGGDGWLTAIGGGLILLAGLVTAFRSRPLGTFDRVLVLIVSALVALVAIVDLMNLSEVVSETGGDLFAPSIGPGLFVILLGCVVTAAGMFVHQRRSARWPPLGR